ncbi:MAG: hypothetical protein GY832_11530 [Chloroflexi bacterium]|nr:hypothetical protein [Chloroflexota bacterium]
MAEQNGIGRRVIMWLAILTPLTGAMIFSAGFAWQAAAKVATNDAEVVKLRETVARIYQEGTRVCKDHTLSDAQTSAQLKNVEKQLSQLQQGVEKNETKLDDVAMLQREVVTKLEIIIQDKTP